MTEDLRLGDARTVRNRSAIAFLLVILGSIGPGTAAGEPGGDANPVLVLYSYDEDLPCHQTLSPMLESGLESVLTTRANIFTESMGLWRHREPEYYRLPESLYGEKYGHHGIALIIAVDPPALNFLTRHGPPHFTDVPVIANSGSGYPPGGESSRRISRSYPRGTRIRRRRFDSSAASIRDCFPGT